VASPSDAVDVGLTIKLTPVSGSDRTTILLTAEPYSVSLEPKLDRFHGRFDVRCVQFAADARSMQDFTDEIILNPDQRDAQRTIEEGFHYTREIELHPDARTLVLVWARFRSACSVDAAAEGLAMALQLPVDPWLASRRHS